MRAEWQRRCARLVAPFLLLDEVYAPFEAGLKRHFVSVRITIIVVSKSSESNASLQCIGDLEKRRR